MGSPGWVTWPAKEPEQWGLGSYETPSHSQSPRSIIADRKEEVVFIVIIMYALSIPTPVPHSSCHNQGWLKNKRPGVQATLGLGGQGSRWEDIPEG